MPNESKQGMAEDRTELAEERTDWAQERTLLAKQRTFSAWVRTGLAAMAVGFAIAQLLGDVQPQWMVRTIGTILILTGGAIHGIGFWGYRKTLQKLEQEGVRGISIWFIGLITLALVLSAGIGLVLILLGPSTGSS